MRESDSAQQINDIVALSLLAAHCTTRNLMNND